MQMPSRKIGWLEAAWIFFISRLIILFVTVIASSPSDQPFWLLWLHWDVLSYINVAKQGYDSLRNTVFFPLWPLLIHCVGALFDTSTLAYYVAGLLLANLFFYFTLVLLYYLVSEHFDPMVAKNALFYLAFSPYAIFFFAGYTESLFLFLFLAAFLCLQYSHYWLAGLCGFLAALTHAQGVLLIVPFAIVVLQRFWLRSDDNEQKSLQHRLRACLPLLLIPMGVVVFMLYLEITKHSPFAFSVAEAQSWQRHFTFPLVSVVLAIQTFFRIASPGLRILNFLDIISVLIPLAILIRGWKGLPLHYALFALVMILFNISYPQGMVEPLAAVPRYMLIVFPIFIILGEWGKRQYIDRIITVCSISLFALNVLLFVEHYWVA